MLQDGPIPPRLLIIYTGTGSSVLCPVYALTQYLHLRGSTPLPPVSTLRWYTFKPPVAVIHHPVHSVFGRSFRIGAATSAASCGLPGHLIKTLGRWSSDAYQIYIRTPISTFIGMFIPSPVMLLLSDRVPRDLGKFRAMASPSHEPFVSPTWTYG